MITKTQNMENQSRIEELLSDALRKYDQMLEKHDETNHRLASMENRLETMDQRLSRIDDHMETVEHRLGGVEVQIQKSNLQTSENTRAILKLGNELERVFEHERRIAKLEVTVYK